MQLKVIIVDFSAVTCSKTIFRQDFALLTPTGVGGGGVTSEPHLVCIL